MLSMQCCRGNMIGSPKVKVDSVATNQQTVSDQSPSSLDNPSSNRSNNKPTDKQINK